MHIYIKKVNDMNINFFKDLTLNISKLNSVENIFIASI